MSVTANKSPDTGGDRFPRPKNVLSAARTFVPKASSTAVPMHKCLVSRFDTPSSCSKKIAISTVCCLTQEIDRRKYTPGKTSAHAPGDTPGTCSVVCLQTSCHVAQYPCLGSRGNRVLA